jgi:hypothetical protein
MVRFGSGTSAPKPLRVIIPPLAGHLDFMAFAKNPHSRVSG